MSGADYASMDYSRNSRNTSRNQSTGRRGSAVDALNEFAERVTSWDGETRRGSDVHRISDLAGIERVSSMRMRSTEKSASMRQIRFKSSEESSEFPSAPAPINLAPLQEETDVDFLSKRLVTRDQKYGVVFFSLAVVLHFQSEFYYLLFHVILLIFVGMVKSFEPCHPC
jgi:hypothetical protein